jgi:hypothetical protein
MSFLIDFLEAHMQSLLLLICAILAPSAMIMTKDIMLDLLIRSALYRAHSIEYTVFVFTTQ